MLSENKGCHPLFIRPWRQGTLIWPGGREWDHLSHLTPFSGQTIIPSSIITQKSLQSSLNPNNGTITTIYKMYWIIDYGISLWTLNLNFWFLQHEGAYPYVCPEPHLHTVAEHFNNAMNATPQQPVMGVKGPGRLMKLDTFQMVQGFGPEYRHRVCLGVTRQLASGGSWKNSLFASLECACACLHVINIAIVSYAFVRPLNY